MPGSRPIPPQLAVGAVVLCGGHLLLVERGRPPAAGLWSVPGGRVEAGERLESAVEREVREETGLTVSCGSLLGWVQRLGESHNFVILDFEATLDPTHAVLPALEPGDDASAARWVHVDRLAEMRLVPGLLDFLIEHGVVPRYSSSSSGTSASSVDDSAD